MQSCVEQGLSAFSTYRGCQRLSAIKFSVGHIAISLCFNIGLEVSSSEDLNLGHVFSTAVWFRKTSNDHPAFWNVPALLSILVTKDSSLGHLDFEEP